MALKKLEQTLMQSLLKFFNKENNESDNGSALVCPLQGKWFAALTARANSPMLLISNNGKLIDINPRGCQLFENSREELIGRALNEFWTGQQSLVSLIAGMAENQSKAALFEYTAAGGRQKTINLEIHSCLHECGETPCYFGILFDVTVLRKREEALERTLNNRLEASSILVASAEGKYQSLVEASPDWISLLGPDGKIQVVNSSGALILGMSAADILNTSLVAYFSESEAARLEECLAKAAENKSPITSAAILEREGGQKFLNVVFNPLLDSDGAVTRIVAIITDVTARRQAEIKLKNTLDTLEEKVRERTEQLEHLNLELTSEIAVRHQYEEQLHLAKVAAEAANQAKSEFLANMSHEIRTPMNSVLGFTNLLLITQLDDRQKDFALTVKSSGNLLLALIDDILDLSKIEAHKLELELLPFLFASMLTEVVKLFEPKAHEKNIAIDIDVEEIFSKRTVIGDKQRIRQVLINLVGNAVKFTRKGKVTVKATSHNVSGQTFFADVVIEDSGIGIEKKNLARIFGKFTQADSNTTRTFGGTGLGLAISKGLIELMGGTIGVCSTPGEGSEFFFQIPLALASHEEAVETSEETSADQEELATKEPGRTRILVADDDNASRKLVEQCITAAGHSSVSAKTGAEAMAALRGEIFGLIIMDWLLPERSGLLVTRELRQKPGPNQNTPVIFITARAMKGDREKCLEAGANLYLSKPFEPNELLRIIGSVLRQK